MSAPVLVWVDATDGEASRASLQAIQAARTLAAALGTQAQALAAAADVAARYLPLVHRIDGDASGHDVRTRAAHEALTATGAAAFVTAANRSGQAVAPRVAVRAEGALLEEVSTLEVQEGTVVATRLSQLQRVTETIHAAAQPVVVTVKLGAFEPADPADAPGEVRDLPVDFTTDDRRVRESISSRGRSSRIALEEADVVVAGGRGVGSQEGFSTWIEPLATALHAGIGATRAVVDAGWRPYHEQIGQTGKTVAPELYLAVGISGAVQHLSGMNRSRRIVAIDKDPDAPIFQHCDLGIVGDARAVVTALLEALEADAAN